MNVRCSRIWPALQLWIILICAGSMAAQTSSGPTVAEAEAFMRQAEARLSDLSIEQSHADWVHANFITEDSEVLSATASERTTAAATELVEQAKRFDKLQLPPELARKFSL